MNMSAKSGSLQWKGQGKAGVGYVSTETGALKDASYSACGRFEDGMPGTNPEEILGAAHVACFTMMFSFLCDAAGFETKSVKTGASVDLLKKGDGALRDLTKSRLEGAGLIEEDTGGELAGGGTAPQPFWQVRRRL
jgi:lipoyl-dependent peroxiredoxin